jgi:nucleoside-diphosphate-sugar epimerase
MKKIVIDGASGWMGRSTIQAALEFEFSDQDLILFSSSKATIEVSGKLFPNQLGRTGSIKDVDVYVHTAFVTREHYGKYGEHEYVTRNLQLLDHSILQIERLRPKSIVFLSSGIAKSQDYLIGKDSSYRTYASLKQIEAQKMRLAATKIEANLVEGVLFSATGTYMKDPSTFAIGNILHQALQGEIRLRANRLVWRRYCDSIQFMKVLLKSAISGRNLILESGGALIELRDLARQCLTVLGLQTSISWQPEDLPPDLYFSRSSKFELELAELGETSLALEDQILNTLQALKDF